MYGGALAGGHRTLAADLALRTMRARRAGRRAQAGEIDANGDVVDAARVERLRRAIGPHIAADCDPDDSLYLSLRLLEGAGA